MMTSRGLRMLATAAGAPEWELSIARRAPKANGKGMMKSKQGQQGTMQMIATCLHVSSKELEGQPNGAQLACTHICSAAGIGWTAW